MPEQPEPTIATFFLGVVLVGMVGRHEDQSDQEGDVGFGVLSPAVVGSRKIKGG